MNKNEFISKKVGYRIFRYLIGLSCVICWLMSLWYFFVNFMIPAMAIGIIDIITFQIEYIDDNTYIYESLFFFVTFSFILWEYYYPKVEAKIEEWNKE